MVQEKEKPLIVQGDGTIFLDVDSDSDQECRERLSRFAELVKSPEHIHTYRITPLAIWNAASARVSEEEILTTLRSFSKYEVPGNIQYNIHDWFSRYGKVKLLRSVDVNEYREVNGGIPEFIYLVSEDSVAIQEILNRKAFQLYIDRIETPNALRVKSLFRGRLKQALIKVGYPVEDLVGFLAGDPLEFSLMRQTRDGTPLSLRPYQLEAIHSFMSGGDGSRSGIVVLPSGAGKTIVGMGVMEQIRENTLIITTGTVAVRQWIRELIDKSSIDPLSIGEYTGESKEILPVTVSTYQVLTYSPRKRSSNSSDDIASENDHQEGGINPASYPHLEVFRAHNWGLIIYDEVHLLPAPVFKITSEIQAKKRLGLTATLVREDGKEDDVFSLVGPKKYDAPWKKLEKGGWIATAECHEVRVKFPNEHTRMEYSVAPLKYRYRLAAENPMKIKVLKTLLSRYSGDDSILVIGDYIDQLQRISQELNAPVITGKMKIAFREELYDKFRRKEIQLLVVSKVANYAIDLPDANVAIQVSGTFGSRQEEAQRLGRLLRPKKNGTKASFYSIVTKDTVDQEYSMRRQLFLTERGYSYNIIDHDEIIMDLQTERARDL